jgi:hypothetical protein
VSAGDLRDADWAGQAVRAVVAVAARVLRVREVLLVAVDAYRELAGLNRDAYLPDLVKGLWTFAWVRNLIDEELAKALIAIEESVQLYTEIIVTEPAAYEQEARSARSTMADVLTASGQADRVRRLLTGEATES